MHCMREGDKVKEEIELKARAEFAYDIFLFKEKGEICIIWHHFCRPFGPSRSRKVSGFFFLAAEETRGKGFCVYA